ncbi:hypothetical protein KBZ21_36160, partial [Streptomyces sp. A73]|nr:hypothetical protein [Streptomyces sp. A73]
MIVHRAAVVLEAAACGASSAHPLALEAGQTLEVAMGPHGPIPQRSEERRRRNKDEGPELSKAPSGAPGDLPELPEPDELWQPIAR